MNRTRPHWWVAGIFTVSLLWLAELSNRPDGIPDYSKATQRWLKKTETKPAATQKAGNPLLDNKVDSDSQKGVAPDTGEIVALRQVGPIGGYTPYKPTPINPVQTQKQPFVQGTAPDARSNAQSAAQNAYQEQSGLSEY